MKGTNKLILNQDSMVEVVQCWLNSHMLSPPQVVYIHTSQINTDITFEIQLHSADHHKPRNKAP